MKHYQKYRTPVWPALAPWLAISLMVLGEGLGEMLARLLETIL